MFVAYDDLPDELPAYEAADWAGRSIDGRWLAAFLIDPDAKIHRRGVTIVGARITGGLDLEGVELEGWLRLLGCQFGPHGINLAEARARSLGLGRSSCGPLTGHGLGVTGNVSLNDGFTASGPVRLARSVIGGSLVCSGGRFSYPRGPALGFRGADIGGDVRLDGGCAAEGEVSLRGATIGGDLDCRGGVFANEGGIALAAHQAHIARTVLLARGFQARGRVNFMLTTIGGDFDCTGGHFASHDGPALVVHAARIGRSVWLNSGFSAEGAVVLAGTRIGGDLDCTEGRFVDPDGSAIRAERAHVDGAIVFGEDFTAVGEVRLQHTSAGTLVDHGAGWPERIDLDGFRYAELQSPDRGWRERREWLRRQSRPSSQGYVQLADVYRASGEDHDARKILIERHDVLLRPPAHWGSPRSRLDRLWRLVLRVTVGYGYEPWRVLLIAVPLLVAMSLWYSVAADHDVLVPTDEARGVQASDCDSSYTCVQPVIYALDTLLPLVDFGQRSAWVPDQSHHDASPLRDGHWLATATWTMTALGWISATLVAASFTQAIRRE